MDEHYYTELLNRLPEGIYCLDNKGFITLWNRAAEEITGYPAAEALGMRCSDNLLAHIDEEGLRLCVHGCPLAATMEDGQVRETDVYLHHREGHRVPVSVRSAPLYGSDGDIVGAVETFVRRHSRLELLEELATLKKEVDTDPLTGIGNRRLGEAELARRMERLATRGEPFGILLVDVDRFKRVNDTFGHEAGDKVLRMVARTLAGSLRGQDEVCRWGGEEFLVILPGVDRTLLRGVAERLRQMVASTWLDNQGKRLSVTICLGGALAKDPAMPLTRILAEADKCMYRCKENGRNTCALPECDSD